ncbi:MAG: DNA ligase (NAD+) [Parcubacteria group bacterium Gr01-1014_33]|nr:MAG: DNA ligase (NAD+) [Parcubacteria group bacterium Gr01-1014_33]
MLTPFPLVKPIMDYREAKKRAAKLRKEIDRHRYLYHVLDRQEISDAALDSLKHELVELEKKFPDLITPDSPTQRVSGTPLPGFKKVRHALPMLSLNDAFSEDEIAEWEARIKKVLPRNTPFDYFAELKIDGFAISLIYENGALKTAATRGDGSIGEEVRENIKTIDSIPLTLTTLAEIEKEREIKTLLKKFPDLKNSVSRPPRSCEIRGEIYMTKQAFEAINKERSKKGLPLFANPRNIAAGSVRQLDPRQTALRRLEFFAYDITTDIGIKTHEEKHAAAKIFGFKTIDVVKHCGDKKEILDFWREVLKKREKLPFLIDGIVVQVNQVRVFERLGVVGKAPRGAIAFKFPAEEAVTRVQEIVLQAGRTGVLTPVAVLEPISVGGVTVSRATLHNMDEIKRLDVRVGDTVIIQRAGDVIPDIVRVLKNLRPTGAKAFRMPRTFCGESVVRNMGEAAHRIAHPEKCALVTRERICHFVSKNAFDIQGLGPKIINRLCDEGLIQDAADLFSLKAGDIKPLERFAEKSAENLIRSIQSKKEIELPRVIYALGILHVGEETALDLAAHFGTLKKLERASEEELEHIPNIGGVVARAIYEWFQNEKNREFIKKLLHRGVHPQSYKLHTKNYKLQGITFVLTGGLETLTRDEAKARIRELGGDISESVSKKTGYVVAGKDPGSKLKQAEKLRVKVIGEKDLLKLIGS